MKRFIYFGLLACLLCIVACDFGNGTLNLDEDDSVVVPPSNSIPSTSKSTLPAELQYLHQNVQSGQDYTIEITGSGNIGAQDLLFSDANNVTIRLEGGDRERVIQLADEGILFNVGAGVTLVVGRNITLRGHESNNTPLVSIASRGTLILEAGAKISNNTNTAWSGTGGVAINTDGTFFMKGGEVSSMGRYAVYVLDGGYFSMEGGRISNNRNMGVGVANGFFVMSGGEISNNASTQHGGGVNMSDGIFTMEGGRISGNTASSNGGGVYVSNATFEMLGGEIFGNTARSGGGVFVENNATFSKTGGTVFGYVLGDGKRNTATDGITSNDRGHAVFVSSSPSKRRETTAGIAINLNSDVSGAAGGWE